MPFVSNDIDWLLIDDEKFHRNPEKYSGYVVARRLFVSSETSFPSSVSNKQICCINASETKNFFHIFIRICTKYLENMEKLNQLKF